MKKEKLNSLVHDGYRVKLYINGALKALLYKEGTNVVYPVYYNHVKALLNNDQLMMIDAYNRVKNWSFKNDVEANIKFKSETETVTDIQNRIVRSAIKHQKYLEQL